MYHGLRDGLSPWFDSLGYTRLHGDEADWALDLVAVGFDKPQHYYGNTLRSLEDVHAAADAFMAHYVEVWLFIMGVASQPPSDGAKGLQPVCTCVSEITINSVSRPTAH